MASTGAMHTDAVADHNSFMLDRLGPSAPPSTLGSDVASTPTASTSTSTSAASQPNHDHRQHPGPSSLSVNHGVPRSTTPAPDDDTDASYPPDDPECQTWTRRPSPPPREANAPPPAEEVTPLRLAAHYAGLVLASMLGCLARLGLEGLGEYDGRIIYPLAWSQGVGSGVMGLALARKNEIIAIYPPIYTFLTTGIAGSITTFSSWMLEGYLSFSNFSHYDRRGLHDTVDGVAYSLSTFAIATASLYIGEHVSSVLPSLPTPKQPAAFDSRPNSPEEEADHLKAPITRAGGREETRERRPRPRRRTRFGRTSATPMLDTLTIASAFLSYLIVLLLYFLGPGSWRHKVTFPLLLSPPGAMLRFFLSRWNTRQAFLDGLPVGTFAANMLATLVISGVFAAQRRPVPSDSDRGGRIRCDALNAIQQGFCGCLSTVSTFVVEARAIRGWKRKWFYVGLSVVLGHLLVLAIVGGTGWSLGYGEVCAG